MQKRIPGGTQYPFCIGVDRNCTVSAFSLLLTGKAVRRDTLARQSIQLSNTKKATQVLSSAAGYHSREPSQPASSHEEKRHKLPSSH